MQLHYINLLYCLKNIAVRKKKIINKYDKFWNLDFYVSSRKNRHENHSASSRPQIVQ